VRPQLRSALLLVTLAGAACRDASTGTSPEPGDHMLLASLRGIDARSGFSPWSDPVNLGAAVNSDGLDQDPTLSPDGLSLYFTSDRPGGYGIWISHRDCPECAWQTPVKLQLVPDDFEGGLGPTQAVGAPAFSRDGHLLFFSRCVDCDASHFPGTSDIFVARRPDTKNDFDWEPAVPLGPDVNTAANEDHPFYLQTAEDGTANLYFCRTEPGSSRFDIYSAAVTRDGETRGPAVMVSELSLPGVNDVAPTLRADGREIIFQSNRPGGVGTRADLWMSTRQSVHDPWSAPENVGTLVNTSAAELQPSLSFDGRTLLFASDRAGSLGNDIWISTRTHTGAADGDDAPRFSAWSAPVNLGPPVNTPFIEQAASLSRDGRSLYFHCGNCPGSIGGADIYVSQRVGVDDPWGPPQNLGPTINTTANEQAPRLSRDGRQLLFSSDRSGGFGGHDIYVSRRDDKRDDFAWQPPVNLGSGVNGTDDDQTPDPFEDRATGTTILYFGSGPIGTGATDIYASALLPDGSYGPRAPVVELNSTSVDRQPAIRRDGLEIFFASDRTGSLGALDLWVSTRASTSDPWLTPVNLGPVVNGTQVDARPALSFDGTTLYFQSTRPGAVGCSSPTGPCVFDLWVTMRTRVDDGDDDDRVRNRAKAKER